MKCLTPVLIVLCVPFLFVACSEDDSTDNTVQSIVWELSEIESFNGEIIIKEDIIFNETIELKPDNSFTKIRTRDGGVIHESSGTYTYEYADDATYLHLDHNADNDFIINCTGELRETLTLEAGILTNNSSACDWPVLRFFMVN